jgi:hypothetical protein
VATSQAPSTDVFAVGKISFPLFLVYAVWAIVLFNLNFFLAIKLTPALGRLANLAFVPLLGLIVLRAPTIMGTMRSWIWYFPFLLLVVASLGSIPILTNTWMAWLGIQTLLQYYVLAVATSLYVRTPGQAMPIIAMVVLRFLWWALWARMAGKVAWDPSMSNEDGFGSLMVQGVALCFWFGMATRVRWQRLLMFVLAAYSVIGVVSSAARGAFLALVVVGVLVWLRSPRKVVTGAGIIVGVVIVILAADLLFTPGQGGLRTYRQGDTFWAQIMTAFSEGTDEGTGAHRWGLWQAAMKVWLAHPIFGVGPNNFGVFAAYYIRPGEIEGFESMWQFWGVNLHSAYFQILSEFGVVGVSAFIWLMVDFLRKNLALRRPEAIARWNALGLSTRLDLRALSLGLEAGVVATFLVNIVYASFFEPWFLVLWVLNRVLWALTSTEAAMAPAAMRVTPRRMQRQRQVPA